MPSGINRARTVMPAMMSKRSQFFWYFGSHTNIGKYDFSDRDLGSCTCDAEVMQFSFLPSYALTSVFLVFCARIFVPITFLAPARPGLGNHQAEIQKIHRIHNSTTKIFLIKKPAIRINSVSSGYAAGRNFSDSNRN
jgi:hypothetical protein